MATSNNRNKKDYSFIGGAMEVVARGPFNILLLCVPIAFFSQGFSAPPVVVFIFALFGIAPLAERLGFITEQLAKHTNDTIGGLLNVTFGNATELIIAIFGLFRGLYRVVQLTLLGSILSNLLLVLGSAFLFGGLKRKKQHFGHMFAETNTPLLLIASMSVAFPTVLYSTGSVSDNGLLMVSRCASLVLLVLYCLFLFFQMNSHHFLFEEEENEERRLIRLERQQSIELAHLSSLAPGDRRRPRGNSQESRSFSMLRQESKGGEENEMSTPRALLNEVKNPLSAGVPALRMIPRGREESIDSLSPGRIDTAEGLIESGIEENNAEDDDDDEDEDVLGVTNSIIWLCVVSILISFLSDAIVDTIEAAAKGTNLSNVFLAAIVVPIVGNAAEHTSAVVFGMKNRLNLALAIAVGSATQIGLFLLPVVILLGWMAGVPMSLNYEGYEVIALTLSVLLVGFVLSKGRSTWLDGVTLIGTYAVICGGFWSHGSESDL